LLDDEKRKWMLEEDLKMEESSALICNDKIGQRRGRL
jgi:hypothetical protein